MTEIREAVIVSAVRSAVGKGKKDGGLASVHPTELSAWVMRAAVQQAGVDPTTIDDIFWGCAMPEASQGLNDARLASLRAGFPVEVPSATILDGLAKLKPAFKVKGTVTAGNSSPYSDGAAALVLMSRERATALGITPLARFITFAASGVEPDVMGIAPVKAVPKALKRAK